MKKNPRVGIEKTASPVPVTLLIFQTLQRLGKVMTLIFFRNMKYLDTAISHCTG